MLGKTVSHRLQEFENIFKKSGGSWENFRIGDLFDIGTGSLLSANELVDGRIKRLSAKSDNNGLIGMYDTYGNNKARHFENFISVNFFGDVFYWMWKLFKKFCTFNTHMEK